MKKVTSFLLRGSIMDATPLNTKLKALRTTLGRLFFQKTAKRTCVQLSHGITFFTFEDEHSGKPAQNKNEIKTNQVH